MCYFRQFYISVRTQGVTQFGIFATLIHIFNVVLLPFFVYDLVSEGDSGAKIKMHNFYFVKPIL